MELTDRRVLVTGGAGFVGSHLAEALSVDNEVVVADDLSSGKREWVPEASSFVDVDLVERGGVASVLDGGFDIVFHLASRADANDDDSVGQFAENTRMTHEVLRRAREVGVNKVAYTSSSVVYGEAPRPTPEDYAPLEPISEYGAAKLAEEGLLSTYAHSYEFTVWNVRFANVVGSRLRGAVIPDFIEKLRADSSKLEILGDGRQEKSYLHVSDCVAGVCSIVENVGDGGGMHSYNLGTRTTTSVDRIAEIVSDVLGVEPEFEYTGGDRGWTGDVPRMRLDIEKVGRLGWEPELESEEAVRRAAAELAAEL